MAKRKQIYYRQADKSSFRWELATCYRTGKALLTNWCGGSFDNGLGIGALDHQLMIGRLYYVFVSFGQIVDIRPIGTEDITQFFRMY